MTRVPRSLSDSMVVEMNRQESGVLLAALAELPFKTVFALIGNLNAQAHAHFREASEHAKRKPFGFAPTELEFCARAMEALPYRDVHAVLERMHRVLETRGS